MKKRPAAVTAKIMFFFLVLIIVVFMINSYTPVFAQEGSTSSAASIKIPGFYSPIYLSAACQ